MPFDVEAARRDGVSDSQIADYLADKAGFDVASARNDKVPDSEIVNYLLPKTNIAPPSAPEKSYSERKTDISNAGFEQLGSSFNNLMADHVGDTNYSPVEDLMGMAGGVGNAFMAPVTAALQPATRSLAKSVGGPETQAQMAAGNFERPDKLAQDTVNLGAALLPAFAGDKVATTPISSDPPPWDGGGIINAPPGTLKSLLKNKASGNPDAILPIEPKITAKDFDPAKYHAAISDSYGGALKDVGVDYNKMRTEAQGKYIPTPPIADSLSEIIADIKNPTSFHEARSVLPKLEKIQKGISESGDTISLNDAVALKKLLNTKFNSSRFQGAQDTPYAELGLELDKSLDGAAEVYPRFGALKKRADINYVNKVVLPYQKNTVLQKIWKPEDYYAQRGLYHPTENPEGLAYSLPAQTQQRAGNMLGNIGDQYSLDAIRGVLPEDMATALTKAKMQEIKAANGRVANAGKLAKNAVQLKAPSALRNAADIISPSYSASDAALLEYMKANPTVSRFQTPDMLFKGEVLPPETRMPNVPRISGPSSGPLMLGAPPPGPQSIPGPRFSSDNFSVDTGGNTRPMTQSEVWANAPSSEVVSTPNGARHMSNTEKLAADIKRTESAAKGLTPDVARSSAEFTSPASEEGQILGLSQEANLWDKQAKSLEMQGKTYKEIINRLGKRPVPYDGMKNGGSVNLTTKFLVTAKGRK